MLVLSGCFEPLNSIRYWGGKMHILLAIGVVRVIVRPLCTVGYTSVVASVIYSRQWSN